MAPPDLRPPATTFVGRERELAGVRTALADPAVRVLALTGPPGVGKTRLAVEAAAALAASYRAGAVAVALAPLRDPGVVVPAIRQALALGEDGFAAAHEAGGRLSMGAAVEEALGAR